jgi:hypothetical protein
MLCLKHEPLEYVIIPCNDAVYGQGEKAGSEALKNYLILSVTGVTIRNHAYQKLFPFVVTHPCSLLPLPPSRVSTRHVIKLPCSEPSTMHVVKLQTLEPFPFPHIVQYDVKLHLPGLGPDARYGTKLQLRTSWSPRQYW